MEDKDLDKLFQEAFKEAEEIPRPEIWVQIENKLKDDSKVVPIRKRNNWWSYAAAAAIFVSISGYLTSKVFEERSTIKLTANVPTPEKATSNYNYNTTKSQSVDEKLKQDNNTKYEHLVNYREKNSDNNLEAGTSKVELVYIEELTENQLLANIKLEEPTSHLPIVRQVTEIDDIKPIFEFEEESESMYAATPNEGKEKKNIITTLLNNITDNIDSKVNKEVRFHTDDEGSFSISILNSIAKNPTKKRK